MKALILSANVFEYSVTPRLLAHPLQQPLMERPMTYSLLADLTVLVHVMFVLFVVCGGVAVLRRPRLAWLHLPAAMWGGFVEIKGWVCPLTHLENHLRRIGGEAGYGGSFIEHYLQPLLYPPGLTIRLQVIMGLGVLAVNAAIYARLWKRR